jgi:voltage-gated potassium channel Kch
MLSPPMSRRYVPVIRREASGRRPPRPSAGPDPGARATLRQRFRYAFDNTMSRGTPALVGYLGLATAALIGIATAIVFAGDFTPSSGRHSLAGRIFTSFTHAIDPGTVAGDTGKWPFVVAMLLTTLAGLFVVSALIGVLATGLDAKIQELRKGRSVVLERDHTLILGWSDTVYTILRELEIANQSEKDPCVVLLAERDKVEMEDLIRDRVGHGGRTRVVCRSGSPIDLADLDLVRPQTARSIIVLAPEGEEPDSQVIKTVLALTKGAGHRERHYHIVAEIQDPAHLEVARLVGGEQAILIDKRQTIARLIVQAARQSGVSVVYTELLDFGGDELYFREDQRLVGMTFGDALLAYEDCAVIGIDEAERVLLNPPPDRAIAAGDRVIAIAEDDGRLADAPPCAASVEEGAIVATQHRDGGPQRSLVLGWNERGSTVVSELDEYMRAGSEVTIVAEHPSLEEDLARDCGDLRNLQIRVQSAVTTDRPTLDALRLERFDHVIVLCYSDSLDAQRADARTLVTLLHLRDLADKHDAEFSIVSEMVDDRNRELAEVTRVDDVIVSDKLISLMLAQISENAHLKQVFGDLFAAAGSEVYLKPLREYLREGAEASFATLVEAARRRGETAIGYRRAADSDDASRRYGVRINPPKSERIAPSERDSAIVLAED